jgi:lysophospholipase L1-like esterase
VAQLYERLQDRNGDVWRLDNRTYDGCTIEGVAGLLPRPAASLKADLITLTVGGNDLVLNMERDPAESLPEFANGYNALLDRIAECAAGAVVVVGNVYHPQDGILLAPWMETALDQANRIIGDAIATHGFQLANIHGAFRGHERKYLCFGIEPTLEGAGVIADLFEKAYKRAQPAPADSP